MAPGFLKRSNTTNVDSVVPSSSSAETVSLESKNVAPTTIASDPQIGAPRASPGGTGGTGEAGQVSARAALVHRMKSAGSFWNKADGTRSQGGTASQSGGPRAPPASSRSFTAKVSQTVSRIVKIVRIAEDPALGDDVDEEKDEEYHFGKSSTTLGGASTKKRFTAFLTGTNEAGEDSEDLSGGFEGPRGRASVGLGLGTRTRGSVEDIRRGRGSVDDHDIRRNSADSRFSQLSYGEQGLEGGRGSVEGGHGLRAGGGERGRHFLHDSECV